MPRTSVLVSALAAVVVLSAAGVGGVTAQDVGPDSETADTAAVAQQQQPVEAEVIVKDRAGNRLSDIEVTAEWGDGQTNSDTSTSRGRVLIDVPPNTDVEFSVNDSDDAFVRNHQPVRVDSAALDEPVTIQMAPRGGVTFAVVDTNGNPVEDTQLQLTHESDPRTVDIVETGTDGTVTVSGIEQRSYNVNILRAGYLREQQIVEVNEQEVSEEIEIESARVTVDFTVLDDHFSEPRPLEGAEVEIAGGQRVPTDASGEAQARIQVNDDYEVTTILDGYQERTTTLRVGEKPTSLEIRTQRNPAISINQLQNAIVVGQPTQVTITNAYDEPVEGATVSLNDDTVGETDLQGQVVFNITQAGANTIEASYQSLSAETMLEGVDPNQSMDGDESDEGTDESDEETDGSDTADDSENGDDAIGPGFGIVAALGAVIGLALLAARRRP
jgi:hypothetical protein